MQSKTTQDLRPALVIEDDAASGELVRAALGADAFLTALEIVYAGGPVPEFSTALAA
jgi:hypothetical protein